MSSTVSAEELIRHGADSAVAKMLEDRVNAILDTEEPSEAWQQISRQLISPQDSFALHLYLFRTTYADWDARNGPPPAWIPDDTTLNGSNLTALMNELDIEKYAHMHRWSVEHRGEFWDLLIEKLGIVMERVATATLDLSYGLEQPRWLRGAKFNITDSCFSAPPDSTAVVYQAEGGPLQRLTVAELLDLTNRVANGIVDLGLGPGDAVAICMPMNAESVGIYLGLIRAGCVVVSVADSFAADQIAKRLQIANAKAIFTQDRIVRPDKVLPLYGKVVAADAPQAIVLEAEKSVEADIRQGDVSWEDFLSPDATFSSVHGDPEDHTNILFSSGTTGDPKAIPWTQLTPIKCAADGYLHQDIRGEDVVAWPTNLGWMMGPWLIYASLINRATIGLYDGIPTARGFGQFVQDAKVTMLGVVPSLVRTWIETNCMHGLDWRAIRAFSSTGECSNCDEMLCLMAMADYRPVIEYCGGTEIGGGYICGTVVQPASPSTFSTPAMGLDVVILNDQAKIAEEGELFVVPPSIGLSTDLLNRDHHEVYFAGTPHGPNGELLRRHGDQMRCLGGGYYRAHGRVDDTMNLGGIKVSSAEIESVVNAAEGVRETAAVAMAPPGGGSDQLVIFAVLESGQRNAADQLLRRMRQAIKDKLNPLFKVHDVCVVDALPRTASNKVMRRKLRTVYAGVLQRLNHDS